VRGDATRYRDAMAAVQHRNDDDDEHDDDGASAEQDLLVVLKLGNRQMGTAQERQQIDAFASELEAAVEAAGAGEYDGDEIGGGECTLFFCGPDVDRLLGVLRPLLQRSPLARGAHLVRMVATADGRMVMQRLPL
jgi:hypothetical protein